MAGSLRLLAVAACLTTTVAAQSKRIELNDLGREVTLSSPRLSPDGRQVVTVVTRTNYGDNRFERSLVLVDVATGATRDLTPGRRSIGAAEWSPSGDRIAFLDRDGERVQLFVLPLAGGEARRITETKRGVSSFAWRPDGKGFGYLTEDDPVERTGEEKHNKSFEVGANMYLDQAASLSSHLWTVADTGGTPTRVTSGVRSVRSVAWTPDAKGFLLVVWPRPHSGEMINAATIYRDATTGAERVLSDRPGGFGSGTLSPDGRQLALLQGRGPEIGFRSKSAMVVPLEGGTPKDLSGTLDRDIGSVRWLPDSRGMVLTGADLTRFRAWLQPLGGSPRPLDWGTINVSDLDVGESGGIVFVGREPDRPGEIYHAPSVEGAVRRVTSFNDELAGRENGRVETVTWKGPDGFTENGVLIYPPGYTTGKQYPLVLNIHGGPMGTSTEGWSTSNQLLAAQGWLVFSPNYRGSNNMGDKFQSAVVNDAGDGPGRDVMSGIEALKSRGIVDPSRIAATGWSYGGYMTAWLTAHYPVFRAAVAGAAVTDWYDWYSMADMNTWAGFGLGGSPWKNGNAANYWRQSPMAYAHQIKTPTLILSTTGDPRVTVTQSYKYFHALRDNGTKVQFIAYPTGGHFPPDPVHQRDVWRRWVAWIAGEFAQGPQP